MQEAELRQLFDSLPAITIRDLWDRALLGVFVYTFARVSEVVTMRVPDYRVGGRRADIYLQEKGGVVNRVPVPTNAGNTSMNPSTSQLARGS